MRSEVDRRMWREVAVVIVVAALAGACSGRPQPSARGDIGRGARGARPWPTRELASNSGSIEGRVVAEVTGAPVRRVEVSATADAGDSRRTLTDADGRYRISDLPPDRYRITYARAGFVSLDLGQRGPFTLGREVEVGEGEAVRGVDVRLTPGAAIVGRVVDEAGEPIGRALVEAVRWGYLRGQRVLQPVPGGSATTDDLGQYRLHSLPAGGMFLRASMNYRGASAVEDERGLLVFYVPAYYPGMFDVAKAQPLELQAGQVTRAKDFVLGASVGARLTGRVVRSSGSPPQAGEITLLQFADRAYDRPIGGPDSARLGRDGSFEIAGLAPGRYLLQVQTSELVERPDRRGGVFHETRGFEFALAPITVTGDRIEPVRIVTSRGGSVRGRIVFDSGATPRFGPNSVSVTAPSVGFPLSRSGAGGGRGGVRSDWTFELTGLLGPRVFRATEPVGWTLKAVRLDGRDITDTPIEFKGTEELTGLEIVLSNETTEITGRVTGGDGKTAMDYAVVIFPEDEAKWNVLTLPAQAGPASRVVKVGRPDQHGRFRVTGLPAGQYLAVAVPSIEDGAWNVSALLARLRPLSKPVTLADGERKTLELKLTSAGG
jgi:hypothetical protein